MRPKDLFLCCLLYTSRKEISCMLVWQPSVLAYQRVYRWFWMERDCNTLIFFIVDGKKKILQMGR